MAEVKFFNRTRYKKASADGLTHVADWIPSIENEEAAIINNTRLLPTETKPG